MWESAGHIESGVATGGQVGMSSGRLDLAVSRCGERSRLEIERWETFLSPFLLSSPITHSFHLGSHIRVLAFQVL